MKLTALAGNGRLKTQLASAAHLPHAVILGGPKGSGRHTLAMLLAQAMVCDHPEAAPCGQCLNCKRVAEGIHPDVIPIERFLSKDELEKDLKVDAIRALRSDAYIRPNQAQRKVYLIARADTMNGSAQNALLKVLEDGPDYAAFLLLAENPMVLLETIRSRCVRYDLAPISCEEALTWLRRRYPRTEEDRLREAALACGGILGNAVEQLEGGGREDPKLEEYLSGLVRAIAKRSELELMEWSVCLQNDKVSRDQLDRLYQGVVSRVRDALVGEPKGRPWREALTSGQLTALSDLAREGSQAMERNVSPAHSAGWFAVSVWELTAASR